VTIETDERRVKRLLIALRLTLRHRALLSRGALRFSNEVVGRGR
jgi:hypothetical protein